MIHIRGFRADDYPAIAAIYRSQIEAGQFYDYEFPDAAAWGTHDQSIDHSRYTLKRYIAELDGHTAGYAQFYHTPWAYAPQRYQGVVRVHPAYQGQGIGTRLYHHLEAAVGAFGGTLRTEIDAAHAAGIRFAARRGARTLFRSDVFHLDPRTFDPMPFARYTVPGVTVTTLAQELARGAHWFDDLYALHNALKADLPLNEPYTPMSRDTFTAYAQTRAEEYFLAWSDGQLIGEAIAKREQDGLVLNFAGVRRDRRGQGVAGHLLLAVLETSTQQEWGPVTAWTESTNPAMQHLLRALGFTCFWSTIWTEKLIPQWAGVKI